MKRQDLVHYSNCLHIPYLSLGAILKIAEDSFSEATAEMGCDNLTLRNKYNCMWVFAKNKVVVKRPVPWMERITVRCRSVKSTNLRNYMLTEILGEDGEVAVTSLIEACVLDVETFRFKKLDTIPFVCNNEEYDLTFETSTLVRSKIGEVTVLPCLIDFSNHLNNVDAVQEYVRTLSIADLDKMATCAYVCTLLYKSQAMLGEKLDLLEGRTEDQWCFAFCRDGAAVVEGSIFFASTK